MKASQCFFLYFSVVAPTIDSPACQEQLIEAAKQVAGSVELLLRDAELSCKDERSVGELRDAARRVSHALNDLLAHIRTGPRRARATRAGDELDSIMTTTDKLISYQGSGSEMIRQAKVLAEATTNLAHHIRGEAEITTDIDHKQRLMGATKKVADATTKMISAAQLVATSPEDAQHQMMLRTAAEEVNCFTISTL